MNPILMTLYSKVCQDLQPNFLAIPKKVVNIYEEQVDLTIEEALVSFTKCFSLIITLYLAMGSVKIAWLVVGIVIFIAGVVMVLQSTEAQTIKEFRGNDLLTIPALDKKITYVLYLEERDTAILKTVFTKGERLEIKIFEPGEDQPSIKRDITKEIQDIRINKVNSTGFHSIEFHDTRIIPLTSASVYFHWKIFSKEDASAMVWDMTLSQLGSFIIGVAIPIFGKAVLG